jgi:hypothetical protein
MDWAWASSDPDVDSDEIDDEIPDPPDDQTDGEGPVEDDDGDLVIDDGINNQSDDITDNEIEDEVQDEDVEDDDGEISFTFTVDNDSANEANLIWTYSSEGSPLTGYVEIWKSTTGTPAIGSGTLVTRQQTLFGSYVDTVDEYAGSTYYTIGFFVQPGGLYTYHRSIGQRTRSLSITSNSSVYPVGEVFFMTIQGVHWTGEDDTSYSDTITLEMSGSNTIVPTTITSNGWSGGAKTQSFLVSGSTQETATITFTDGSALGSIDISFLSTGGDGFSGFYDTYTSSANWDSTTNANFGGTFTIGAATPAFCEKNALTLASTATILAPIDISTTKPQEDDGANYGVSASVTIDGIGSQIFIGLVHAWNDGVEYWWLYVLKGGFSYGSRITYSSITSGMLVVNRIGTYGSVSFGGQTISGSNMFGSSGNYTNATIKTGLGRESSVTWSPSQDYILLSNG